VEFENNAYFWQKIDTLYLSSDLTINQPKGSTHHVYTNLVYPVDYGYLSDSNSDEKISIYKGSQASGSVDAVVVCADILKKDIDVKLLVGCSEKEQLKILEFLDQTDFQKAVIMRRGKSTPKWAVKD
jgi:inorganic pyrophosphatase